MISIFLSKRFSWQLDRIFVSAQCCYLRWNKTLIERRQWGGCRSQSLKELEITNSARESKIKSIDFEVKFYVLQNYVIQFSKARFFLNENVRCLKELQKLVYRLLHPTTERDMILMLKMCRTQQEKLKRRWKNFRLDWLFCAFNQFYLWSDKINVFQRRIQK